MKTLSISGSPRESVGKKDTKALRVKGLVPCVVYGGKEQIPFFAKETELRPLFKTPDVFFVDLNIADKKVRTIVQEVQFHKVNDSLLHVDFFEIADEKLVIMNVPLSLQGSSIGVLKGGKLTKGMRKLKVRALPKDMPEKIEIDITNLDVLDQFRIKDIQKGNFEILEAPNQTVLLVKASRNMVAEPGK